MVPGGCPPGTSLGITRSFPRLYPIVGLVAVALLTLAPRPSRGDRLACLIHAANVHSEPGSNPSKWADLSLGPRTKEQAGSPTNESEINLTGRRMRGSKDRGIRTRTAPSRIDTEVSSLTRARSAPAPLRGLGESFGSFSLQRD